MALRLPPSLQDPNDDTAIGLLRRYYTARPGEPGFYTGSLFDAWDTTDSRDHDSDRFTADDLVAVTTLSVSVKPVAAFDLLEDRAAEFSELLKAVGPDLDLADCDEIPEAAWSLQARLRELPDVGPTTASKLFARKRPRLRPIWDTVVAEVTSGHERFWEPLRLELRKDDKALHRRLLELRDRAGLADSVSAIRVFDVLAWMDGKAGS